MTHDTTGWMTATGPAQTTSPLADTHTPTGATYTVGGTGHSWVNGQGITAHTGTTHMASPEADATGYVFSTPGGAPIPAGGPRPGDMVEIGGTRTTVEVAIRAGLIDDVLSPGYQAPQRASQGPNAAPAGDHAQAGVQASDDASYDITADYAQHIAPNLSPQAQDALTADFAEGEFSEKTRQHLALEGNLTEPEMESVRAGYVDKVSTATGLDEAELEQLYNSDRQAFTAAITTMLKTGSTAAFQTLANTAAEPSYTPLSTDEASNAWRSHDFPQALYDANLEPTFPNGVLHVTLPGYGSVKWTDAVAQGLVTVSRAE